MKNPYQELENVEFIKGTLEKQIKEVISNLTHIHSNYEDTEAYFFKDMQIRLDQPIAKIYDEYRKGLLGLYNCLVKVNVMEVHLEEYVDNIIRNNKLHDVAYYTDVTGLTKIIRLMQFFDGQEGKANLVGYNVNAPEVPNFKVSNYIGEHFMVLGFKCVSYLNSGLEIIQTKTKIEEKIQGQASIIEALFMWIKIGNTFKINHKDIL